MTRHAANSFVCTDIARRAFRVSLDDLLALSQLTRGPHQRIKTEPQAVALKC